MNTIARILVAWTAMISLFYLWLSLSAGNVLVALLAVFGGSLSCLVAWAVPTYLARLGLTIVDIQRTHIRTAQHAGAMAEANDG